MDENERNNENDTPPVTQYVYLDFDGERKTRYSNPDLNLSFSVSVQNPMFSDEQRLAVFDELTKKYESEHVEFLLARPTGVEYSTLYFGISDDIKNRGSFFGVAETHDVGNHNKNDNAFVLLDNTYSTEQIVSVSSHMLDHLLGISYLADGSTELQDYAVKKYLLSTEWNQMSPYNKYCPVDPYSNRRCVTGCSNTGAAQVIYYWIESGILDFSLSLEATDSYSKSGLTINNSSSNASRYKYLSFSETNKLLSNFKLGDTDCIAALIFATGVVQGADYSSSATSTPYAYELYRRSGFKNGSVHYVSGSKYFLDNRHGMKEAGYEVLRDEILKGRPVIATLAFGYGKKQGEAYHCVIIDGYNSSTDEYHVNFGWGGQGNGWYKSKDLNDNYGIEYLLVGIVPDASPNLTVSDLAFATRWVNSGSDLVLNFSISNTGKYKSEDTTVYVYCKDTLICTKDLIALYAGETSGLTCELESSFLSLGENVITVKVSSQKNDGEDSVASQTIKVYDGSIAAEDDTWDLAASGGSRTRIVAEYDDEGLVAETIIADGEYIGALDPVDFRELTLDHAGKYTFVLTDVSCDLLITLYALTAKNGLKQVKSRSIAVPETGCVLSDVPLEKGTYYLSMKAVNEETPGNSDYRIVFSGTGYMKAGNSDDWTDMKANGGEGEVLSVGCIDNETTDLIADEWVGLGDVVDYREFWIPDPAMASFTVTATDAVKFTIYELTGKTDKKGVVSYSIKSLQSTSVKAGATVTTKGQLLPAGNERNRYFFCVESTNAAKGGSADYSVSFHSSGSIFYTNGNNADDWGDMKTSGADGAVSDAGPLSAADEFGIRDWVGFGDTFDYMRFSLETAAKLSFLVDASDAVKFSVFRLNGKTDKKGVTTYSLKSLQSTKLKLAKGAAECSAKTKQLLLDAGEYYFAVESTNAAKGGSADYTLNLNLADTTFFTSGDNSDDWTDMKAVGSASGEYTAIGNITAGTGLVLDNWVGFGDSVDYAQFRLDSASKLSFLASATDATKLTVYKLTQDKKGKWSLKSLQSTTMKKAKGAGDYSATTKGLLLESGEYYIAMESTNAKKGGNAFYTVELGAGTFYDAGDDGWNNYVYDRKAQEPLNPAEFVTTEITSDTASIQLDLDSAGETWDNFVGFGDTADCARITLSGAATLSFTLAATDAAKFVIYRLDEGTGKKAGTFTLKSLQSTTLKKTKGATEFTATTKALSLTGGEYFISMQSTNAAKGGSAFYNVELNHELCAGLPDAGIAAAAADVSGKVSGLDSTEDRLAGGCGGLLAAL